ncbi:MAG TPA: ribokinase [Devosia sp.]|nr:ribokinase [Devosia sp.]
MITVFGSINLDLIGKVARIPRPGETVPGTSFSTAPGGKGANQALAARRAGAEVRLVGAVGTDSFAGDALALLRGATVELERVRTVEGPTGVAMILVDDKGENVIGILPGANAAVTPADAEAAVAGMRTRDVLVVQQEVPQAATRRALELAKARGIVSILNTAPFLADTKDAAPLATIVVANETEYALLTGVHPTERRMDEYLKAHNQTILVTLGSEGARIASPGLMHHQPAPKIVPVDTVAAGDTFVGYLAEGLQTGFTPETLGLAMRRAVVAASLACLKPGAQPSIPYASDVEAALSSGSM